MCRSALISCFRSASRHELDELVELELNNERAASSERTPPHGGTGKPRLPTGRHRRKSLSSPLTLEGLASRPSGLADIAVAPLLHAIHGNKLPKPLDYRPGRLAYLKTTAVVLSRGERRRDILLCYANLLPSIGQ